MKAKYARQIRVGVTRAQRDIAFLREFGTLPPSLVPQQTPLERRAYMCTQQVLIARGIIASWERIEHALQEKGWIN